jgi:hypothetical protein
VTLISFTRSLRKGKYFTRTNDYYVLRGHPGVFKSNAALPDPNGHREVEERWWHVCGE